MHVWKYETITNCLKRGKGGRIKGSNRGGDFDQGTLYAL